MNVLILGGGGMLGPYVARALAPHHNLRITDIKQPEEDLPGEFVAVDAGAFSQVVDVAEGMDAIINLSVLRHDRQLAFDVNTVGCYNMMQAAVIHKIKRVINTGPHFTFAGRSYERLDYEIGPDIPPQPGTNLYALTKSLGQDICKIYTEHHDIYVQMYLFYNFREPDNLRKSERYAPFLISWENAAEVFNLGLTIDLEALPSRCEVFNVLTDMPHGRFRNDKVKRILGFEPREDVSGMWKI